MEIVYVTSKPDCLAKPYIDDLWVCTVNTYGIAVGTVYRGIEGIGYTPLYNSYKEDGTKPRLVTFMIRSKNENIIEIINAL